MIRFEVELDLTGVPCPQNASRALIKLESMNFNEMLKIIVDDGEAYQNLVESLKDEEYFLIKKIKVGNMWRLYVKRE